MSLFKNLIKIIENKIRKPTSPELIDLVWANIDGEYTIYQSELNIWLNKISYVKCPKCGSIRNDDNSMENVRRDGKFIKANCADCHAALCIIVDDIREVDNI